MNAPKQLLIVDGNAIARTALAREVARLGYIVSCAPNAEVGLIGLSRANHPDLVIIDCDLPDSSGCEMVSRLRRRGMTLPVILLANAASEDDVVAGLDAGADDFLVRPLRMREVAARIRAQFRVSIHREEADVRIGMLTFRPATRTAFQPFLSQPVQLTEKEAALLGRLCRAEGRPVGRDTLLREVWGYSPNVSSHTVETHIYRLRRKIEAGPGSPQLIVNDQGGYRLAAHETAEAAQPAAAPSAAPSDAPIKWTGRTAAKAALVPTMRVLAGGVG
jgi:DNA-binding response OmpR family regulator